MTKWSICHIENRLRAFLNGHSLRQILDKSLLSMQIVENPKYSFPPLLQPLHSWSPFFEFVLSSRKCNSFKTFRAEYIFPRLSEFIDPFPPKKKLKKIKQFKTKQIKRLLVFVWGAVEKCSVIILIYLFHVRGI